MDRMLLLECAGDADRQTPAEEQSRSLITFFIGDEEFGIDHGLVREVNPWRRAFPGLEAARGAERVISLLMPVVDLADELHLPRPDDGNLATALVLDVGGEVVAVIVDRVSGLTKLSESCIERTDEPVAGVDSRFVSGVGQKDHRRLIILDPKSVISNRGAPFN